MLENNSSHAFFHLNHFPVMKTYCFLGIPPLIKLILGVNHLQKI